MVPARFAAQVGSRDGVIHAFIPGMVGLVHHLDMAEVLHVVGPFPAGDDHPDRVTLLDTHRLPILAVGHDAVVHALFQRTGVTELSTGLPSITPPPPPFFPAPPAQHTAHPPPV